MWSYKVTYIIYADIESLIKKQMDMQLIQKILQPQKKVSIIPCGYSMSTIRVFDHIKGKHTLYRGKDCMKTSCTFLGEYPKYITDFVKKKNVTVSNKIIKITSSRLYLWKKNLKKAL